LFLTPLGVLVFSALLRDTTPAMRLVVWAAASIAVNVAVGLVARRAGRRARAQLDVPVSHDRIMPALMAVAGLSWGITPLLLGGGDKFHDQIILLLALIAGAAAVNVVMSAGSVPDFLAYQVMLTGVPAVWLLFHDGWIYFPLAVAAVALLIVSSVLHFVVHGAVVDLWTVQWQNQRLVSRLETERGSLAMALRRLNEANEQLGHQAAHDVLTGLPNRRSGLAQLDQQLDLLRPTSMLALLFIDLDRFKDVNDSLGHAAGDDLLQSVALRLTEHVRNADLVMRLGGDEFLVVAPDIRSVEEVHRLAERIRLAVGGPVVLGGRTIVVRPSVGVAITTGDAPGHPDAAELLRQANAALHAAKDRGRNRTEFFDAGLASEHEHREFVEGRLRAALDGGEVAAHLQGVFEVAADNGRDAGPVPVRLVGAEALARIVITGDTLSPAEDFIWIGRSSGLAERLTETVLERALAELPPRLPEADGFELRVNVSPTLLQRDGPSPYLERLIETLPPHVTLAFEILEEDVDDDLGGARVRLESLRALGVSVTLDCFGAGMSSLAILEQLPLDAVKLDRRLTARLTAERSARAVAHGVIQVAHELGLQVIAHGVETAEQSAILLAMGCRLQQGRFFGPPLAADDFARLVDVTASDETRRRQRSGSSDVS
jgi:diguanylate cyclase (GGDEF)-like protein